MEAPQAHTYQDCTDKLMSQFYGPSETMDSLIVAGLTEDEAITFITSVAAGTFTRGNHGQSAQFLSEWRASIASQCSEEYTALREGQPALTREEANQDPNLRKLNAIRKGIGLAMRQDYGYAQRVRRIPSNPFPKFVDAT